MKLISGEDGQVGLILSSWEFINLVECYQQYISKINNPKLLAEYPKSTHHSLRMSSTFEAERSKFK